MFVLAAYVFFVVLIRFNQSRREKHTFLRRARKPTYYDTMFIMYNAGLHAAILVTD